MSQMISLKSISAALSSVDEKKENLREAFENLQFHSSSLSSFTLKWKDIEVHFDSMLKSMEGQLKDLESKEKQAANSLSQKISPSEIEKSPAKSPLKKSEDLKVTPSPKLKSLCVNMDGKGLLSYVTNQGHQALPIVRAKFSVAIQSASDPGKLVLEAMQDLYPSYFMEEKDKIIVQVASLKACLLLLEQLGSISPQIEPQVKDKAKELAVEWKGLLSLYGQLSWRIIVFLQLLVTYDLVSAFSTDELLDLITIISRRGEAIDMFRMLNIPDKAPDLIEKLISNGKQLDAVKFVYAFKLFDRFSPVHLLKEYMKELEKMTKKIREEGNNSNLAQFLARKKEIKGLKGVLKYIEEHNLESRFERNLFEHVKWLEKQNELKNSAFKASEKLQQQKQTRTKRPRRASSESVSPLAQASFHQTGLVFDRVNPYLASSAGPPFAPYMNSLVAPYGLAGTHMDYGGYGLQPQYHPPYYS